MQGSSMEKFDAKIRRRRKVAPADQLKNQNDNNNVEAGKQQESKKGKQPSLKNDQQPPTEGRVRSRRPRPARRDRKTTSQNGSLGVNSYHPQRPNGHSTGIIWVDVFMKSNALSEQDILFIKPNALTHANDVIWHPDSVTSSNNDSFMDMSLNFNGAPKNGTEDNAGLDTPVSSIEDQPEDDDDEEEEAAQNSKVSPSHKTEKNINNFSSVPSSAEKGEEDRQCLLGFGEEESSSERPRNNYYQTLLGTKTAEYLSGYFGTAKRVLWSKLTSTNAIIKWVLMVLNVVLETCQAVLTQEESQGKMGRKIYLKFSIITSSISLTMSLMDAFHKGRKAGAKWRRRGHCCWFYNPGENGQLFGGYMLYFGILCSLVQLVVNLAAKFSNKDFIEFDYVPLLLSACHLVAAAIGSGEKSGGMLATVNCRMHGCNLAEGKMGDGGMGLVFECPICHEDIP